MILLLKKFLSLFAVLLCVAVVNAAAPTYSTTDAIVENGGLFYTIASGSFDTLVGVDSSTIFVNQKLEPDWQYTLVRGRVTGTAADGSGTDSVAMQVRIDALDSDGNLLYTHLADSITTVAGEAIKLPFFGPVIGSKYRVKLIGYTGNGGQVIVRQLYIYKTRPVVINKTWK